MKILIFSDTHLTKDFKEKKFQFLEKIILNSDKVIIAGDFWEGKLITFDEFVNSKWNKLFPLLKKKHCVYIFGNHDKRKYSDKRTSQFSETQTEKYILKHNNKTYVIRHGDSPKLKYSAIKKLIKITHMPEKFFMKYFHEKLEHILTKIFGPFVLQILFKRYNSILITEAKTLPDNEILICGHTHAASLDLQNRYANTGVVRHGIGQYITIEDGLMKLHKETY